jgi:hypothetical protein
MRLRPYPSATVLISTGSDPGCVVWTDAISVMSAGVSAEGGSQGAKRKAVRQALDTHSRSPASFNCSHRRGGHCHPAGAHSIRACIWPLATLQEQLMCPPSYTPPSE